MPMTNPPTHKVKISHLHSTSMTTINLKDQDTVILDGMNWATWYEKLRGTTCLFNCWDVIQGEPLTNATGVIIPGSFNLITKPTTVTMDSEYITDNAKHLKAMEAWREKNSQALGILQTFLQVVNCMQVNFVSHKDTSRHWMDIHSVQMKVRWMGY